MMRRRQFLAGVGMASLAGAASAARPKIVVPDLKDEAAKAKR